MESHLCRHCHEALSAHSTDHSFCPGQNEAIEQWSSNDSRDVDLPRRYLAEYPCYLNVYEVTQAYGGRQEGGWWYDCGEPLESVLVYDEADKARTFDRLRQRYELDERGRYNPVSPDEVDRGRLRGRTSCAGGYDVCIFVEYAFAAPFPRERPHYE